MTAGELCVRLAQADITAVWNPSAHGFQGTCPAHSTETLIFADGEQGLRLLCSAAACTPEIIAEALGIPLEVLLSRNGSRPLLLPSQQPATTEVPAGLADQQDAAILEGVLDELIQQQNPWEFVESIHRHEIPQNDRHRFYQHFINLVAQRPPAEQDALIEQGRGAFHFRAETARRDVAALRESGASQTKVTPLVVGEDFIAYLGDRDGVNAFIVYRPETGSVEHADRVQIGDVVYMPPQSRLVPGDPEPWSERVDGAAVLDEIVRMIRRFVVPPPFLDVMAALWTMHTHVFDAFEVSPYAALLSAEERCAKSTMLTIFRYLTPRPLLVSNITSATLFRTIELAQPTFLIDEAERFLALNEELQGLLNAGHTKEGAQVIRSVGDNHEPRVYRVWCPKGLAQIGPLPTSTLRDRSIIGWMRRRKRNEPVQSLLDALRRRRPTPRNQAPLIRDELLALKRRIIRWGLDHFHELQAGDAPEIPAELHDRARDNWSVLLAIADLAGGDWPRRAREAALALSGAEEAATTSSMGHRLLADIHDLLIAGAGIRALGGPFVRTKLLLGRLHEKEGAPWADYGRTGKPLTAHVLADLLAPYGIRPGKQQVGGEEVRGYARSDFHDAFERFLASEASQVSTPNEITNLGPENEVSTPPPSTLRERHLNPREIGRSTLTTLPNAGNGGGGQSSSTATSPRPSRQPVAPEPDSVPPDIERRWAEHLTNLARARRQPIPRRQPVQRDDAQ